MLIGVLGSLLRKKQAIKLNTLKDSSNSPGKPWEVLGKMNEELKRLIALRKRLLTDLEACDTCFLRISPNSFCSTRAYTQQELQIIKASILAEIIQLFPELCSKGKHFNFRSLSGWRISYRIIHRDERQNEHGFID